MKPPAAGWPVGLGHFGSGCAGVVPPLPTQRCAADRAGRSRYAQLRCSRGRRGSSSLSRLSPGRDQQGEGRPIGVGAQKGRS